MKNTWELSKVRIAQRTSNCRRSIGPLLLKKPHSIEGLADASTSIGIARDWKRAFGSGLPTRSQPRPGQEGDLAIFCVGYDCHKVRDDRALQTALEESGGVRLLDSLWLIALDWTAVELRDAVMVHLDSDDSLVVLELDPSKSWAAAHAREEGTEWLRQYIP